MTTGRTPTLLERRCNGRAPRVNIVTPYMPITSDGDGEALRRDIEDSFKEDPEAEWRDIIEAAADEPS
jgi:hypothetical protein